MKRYTYRIHLQPEPEGGYTVTVPALPGVVTWGSNYDHALEMAQEAIQCMLESLTADSEPIPTESEPVLEIGISVQLSSTT